MNSININQCSILHLVADNDKNGNPRRAFVVMSEGNVLRVVDEGYSGSHALIEVFGKDIGFALMVRICHINVKPAEVKRFLKMVSSEFEIVM
jgi:hypothetical protein